MAEVAAGIGYALKNVAEGAVLLAKGIYDPTLPLRATLRSIAVPHMERAFHTVSVIQGRAYIFGGKTTNKRADDGDRVEDLADNDLHVIILPASEFDHADYTKIASSTDSAPPRRWGHSAAVIDDRIYIYGGFDEKGEPLDEAGKVWVFDTFSREWSHLSPPPDGQKPAPRGSHSSVATEHPRPIMKPTYEGTLPQDPPVPGSRLPEPPAADTYGTIIIQGGRSNGDSTFRDIWTFDISSRTWSELPEPPAPTTGTTSLALAGSSIYAFADGLTSQLDLTQGSHDDRGGRGELGIAPVGPWKSFSSPPTEPEQPHPGPRSNALIIPVTTGQGRNYTVLIGGQSPSEEVLEDIWALQLQPEGMTAASFKDAAREVIKKDTAEAQWAEVRYYNADGVMIQESQEGRGIGLREGLAAARATAMDGASIVIWGGCASGGQARSDGLIVTIE